MMLFLRVVSFFLAEGYAFVFFWLIRTFLPLRRSLFVKLAAFAVCSYLADMIIYANDLYGIFGTLLLFLVYTLVFYRGTLFDKLSVILLFYPALIAFNYLMRDIGSRIFFAIVRAGSEEARGSSRMLLLDASINAFSLFLRLLFWVGVWLILRKFLGKINSQLTMRMWQIVDILMFSSFVTIVTILSFMPENAAIAYPICGAALFSSFGCMYLASYICDSMQTAYRMQELERARNYYKDRIGDEQRVRSIYHDLKNHLLVLQAEAGGSEKTMQSIRTLQSQIEGYENYQHTGNEVLDIILRDKAKEAMEKHIDFSAVVSFEDGGFIEPLDISTIFGNALDNAIEASEKLPEEERLITLKTGRVRDMLVITLQNTTENYAFQSAWPGKDALHGGTTKSDGFAHGFGLTNIRNTVQKYEGQYNISAEEGMCTLKILIPLPLRSEGESH